MQKSVNAINISRSSVYFAKHYVSEPRAQLFPNLHITFYSFDILLSSLPYSQSDLEEKRMQMERKFTKQLKRQEEALKDIRETLDEHVRTFPLQTGLPNFHILPVRYLMGTNFYPPV